MKVAMVAVALLGLTQARVAKRSYNKVGGICFDFGDCIIFGSGLLPCDHTGNNGMLFGLLGTCTDGKTATTSSSSSSGGFLSALGLGKRHGPDENDEVAANATVATTTMSGMAGMSMGKRHGPDDDDEKTNSTTAASTMAGMPMLKL